MQVSISPFPKSMLDNDNIGIETSAQIAPSKINVKIKYKKTWEKFLIIFFRLSASFMLKFFAKKIILVKTIESNKKAATVAMILF